MASGKPRWSQYQGVAFAGPLAITLFGACIGVSIWLAAQVGLPSPFGWGVGVVAGYLLSRMLMRWVLRRTLTGEIPERHSTGRS
jgi:hypothetical protein